MTPKTSILILLTVGLTACVQRSHIPSDKVQAMCKQIAKLGILRREHLKHYRGHVFVAILIIAAVITPTGDPCTLLLVTLPIYLLYELSILIIPQQTT